MTYRSGLAAALLSLLPLLWPGSIQAQEPAFPPLILEDFEAASLGARPYLWRERKPDAIVATVGAERLELDGVAANKALKFEYQFPAAFDASQVVECGPGLREAGSGMALPGSLTGIGLAVFGDGGKNSLGLRLRDRQGEVFDWKLPVTWTGWEKKTIPIVSGAAARSGSRADGQLDLPLTLESIRLVRETGGSRKGEIAVDSLSAICSFGRVATLYDTAGGVSTEGWRAVKHRSIIGVVGESLVPRAGRDVAVLKLEYGYENSADSSVEFQKTMPAGSKHGTFIADVFGDGSNNIVRFRILDAQDVSWQATWASVLVDWSGWRTLYVDTRTLRSPQAQDPSAVLERFPVRFYSLIIDDCSGTDRLPGVESGRAGEIFLGRLLFAEER